MFERRGFTLIEMLLVVAIISILAGIIIIAINPSKQLADSHNAERRSDVRTILNAVYQYSIDNEGSLPATITTSPVEICKKDASSCTGLVNLSAITNFEKYLIDIPIDPTGSSGFGTGYTIYKTGYDRIVVAAPHAQQGAVISAAR